MTKSYHTFFFLLYSIIMNSFIFFLVTIFRQTLSPSFLTDSPLFSSLSQTCSVLITLSADGREKKNSTKRSYSCSLLGVGMWNGRGCRRGRDVCSFFSPTQNQRVLKKSLTKCLAAGRSLGRDQGRSHADVDAGACSAEVLEYCWR